MTAAAIALVQLYLSVAALTGLFMVHGLVAARGQWQPLNRRFLFGLRVTMLLFAGRILMSLTGIEAFRILVLLAAALIPLAVLLLTEGLLRRHAPASFKVIIGMGAALFAVSAFWYGDSIDPARVFALLAFQVLGFLLSGYLIMTRDRSSLGLHENRMVVRLGLSLLLLVPLAIGDFLMVQLGLPVQFSALAVLGLCWLAVSLGRPHMGHRATMQSFVLLVGAALIAGLVIAQLASFTGKDLALVFATILATIILVTLVTDARNLRQEDESLDLLRHLAESRADDPLAFLRALQDHPQVDGAVVVREDSLSGLSRQVLDRIFDRAPVLQRAAPPALGQDADDHITYLFDRFAATHIMQVSANPRMLVALSLPTLGAAPAADLELQVVQRMAYLLDMAGKGSDDGQGKN